MTPEIDPLSAASPDLSTIEMTNLQESIAKLGQLVPIILWRGKILDGRKRSAACIALGLEPRTITIPDDVMPADYAAALNIFRTHFTPSQRAMYAATLANLSNGSNRYARNEKALETSSEFLGATIVAPKTLAQAGAMLGVHRAAVSRAKALRRDAAPEITKAVERGEMSLHAAQQIVKKTPSRPVKASPGSAKAIKAIKGLPRMDAATAIAKLIELMGHHAEDLAGYLDTPLSSAPPDWSDELARVMQILRRFQRRIEVLKDEKATQ